MASVTITIPNSEFQSGPTFAGWTDISPNISIGDSLSVNGATEMFLAILTLPRGTAANFYMNFGPTTGGSGGEAGPEFSAQMETSGSITIVASDNSSLVITGISDATEPYVWSPSNLVDVRAFAGGLVSLTDGSVTVTFNDNAITDQTGDGDGATVSVSGNEGEGRAVATDLMPTAPSVDDQAGFVGQAASTITLPTGTGGDGTLTYALSGLPAGLSFNASNRQITGTPTASGEYIITYTVTDSDSVNPDSDSSQFTYRIAGFDQAGLEVVVYAQIIAAAGGDPYPATNPETVGVVDLVVDDVDITINRIRNSSGGADIRIRRSGSGSWQTEFENTGGAYNAGGWQVTLALASRNIVMDVPGDVNSGTNALNLRMDVPLDDQADLGSLGAGHPFILALSRVASTGQTGDGDGAIVTVSGNEGEGFPFISTATVRTGDGDGAEVTVRGNEGEGEAVTIIATVRTGDGDGARVSIRGNEGEGRGGTVRATSVTIQIPNSDWSFNNNFLRWDPPGDEHISLGDTLAAISGTELFLGALFFQTLVGALNVILSDGTSDDLLAGPEFSDQMEASGTITFLASDGSSVVVTGITDSTEPYAWTPSNGSDVRAFALGLVSLSDKSLTVTFDDRTVIFPVVADQSVPENVAFTITLPEATSSDPPLTYSLAGTLPAGVTFTVATRVLAGTPTQGGTFSLTYFAEDNIGATSSVDFDLIITQTPAASPATGISLVVDTANNGIYDTGLSSRVVRCSARLGVRSSASRLQATVGTMSATLSLGLLDVPTPGSPDDIISTILREGQRVQLKWNGVTIWTGRIKRLEAIPFANTQNLMVEALGPLDDLIDVILPLDIAVAADDDLGTFLARLLVDVGLPVGTIVTSLSTPIAAGTIGEVGDRLTDVLDTLTRCTNSVLAETPNGGLVIASRELTDDSGLEFASQRLVGVTDLVASARRYKVQRPENMFVANRLVLGGDTFSNAESIALEGTREYTDDLSFVHSSQILPVGTNIINIYGERQRVAVATGVLDLWERDSGQPGGSILGALQYGSEKRVHFYEYGTKIFAEPLGVRYDVLNGARLQVSATFRERSELIEGTGTTNFTIRTMVNKMMTYAATIPARSADGSRDITAHLVEYKLTTESLWTRDAIKTTGNGDVTGEFETPTEDLYDIRIVARSNARDEQVGAARCILVASVELFRAQIPVTFSTWAIGMRAAFNASVNGIYRAAVTGWEWQWEGLTSSTFPLSHASPVWRIGDVNIDPTGHPEYIEGLALWVRNSSNPFPHYADRLRARPAVSGFTSYWTPWLTRAEIETNRHVSLTANTFRQIRP